MPYRAHFKHADDIIAHLNVAMPTITDPILKIKYIGFVTVAAVTVYELAIKHVFIAFAKKKHKVLGNFTEKFFRRINGRIKYDVIYKDYISKFGEKYQKRFTKNIDSVTRQYLSIHRRDIKSAYSNLIIWRNDFAHEGKLNTTATYSEVVQAYEDGKEVIHCLNAAMIR